MGHRDPSRDWCKFFALMARKKCFSTRRLPESAEAFNFSGFEAVVQGGGASAAGPGPYFCQL
jgi:hypothetical protein